MSGAGSRISISAPHRIHRMWRPWSLMARDSITLARGTSDGARRTSAPGVRPPSRTRHGQPLLIDRAVFGELRAADPATGAKPVVRAHASAAGDLPIEDEGAFIDVDTVDDFKRIGGDGVD